MTDSTTRALAPALPRIDHDALAERFLRYVAVDTTACPDADSYPSSAGQVELARLLAAELEALGVAATVDRWGYLVATLPGNRKATPIGLVAHLDTSPDAPGAGIKPQIHRDYQGGAIRLPGNPGLVLSPDTCPALGQAIGEDIITSDGTTLLGADDKAGVAAIMTAVEALVRHPEWPRGDLRVVFTPDEEIGKGTQHLDIAALALRHAYTVDGETAPEFNDETFDAASARLTITGHNVHPGKAKGAMINAVEVAADFLGLLPREKTPQATEGREGFIHPNGIEGTVERACVRMIVRDFDAAGLARLEAIVRDAAKALGKRHPGARIDLEIKGAYQNMRRFLLEDPRVVDLALQAIAEAGLTPRLAPIRGGTDGAALSRAGILTPNLFTGSANHHGVTEWVSIHQMARAAEVVMRLARLWTTI